MIYRWSERYNVAHKKPKLDDFKLSNFRESQIVAIENKLPYVTPTQQGRTEVPRKYVQSPYTDLSDSVGTIEKALVFFQMKYPFVESTSFDVDKNLIDSFQLWTKQRLSKKHNRYV